jgi:hypothetical protein
MPMSALEEHHRKLDRLYLSAPTNAYYVRSKIVLGPDLAYS